MRSRVQCLLALALLLVLAPSAHAAFAGANGQIAFDRDLHIWVMDPDGTDERQVATGTDPAWSPDGRRIAYQVESSITCGLGTGAAWQIRIINADGTGDHALTPAPTCSRSAAQPAWSPDGTKIVYTDFAGGDSLFNDGIVNSVNGSALFVIPSAGGTAQKLTFPVTFRSVGRPAWSPDGTRIAFSAETPGPNEEDIFTSTPTGGSLYRVTTNGRQDFAPDWSPDGTRILYTSERDETEFNCDGDTRFRCNTDIYTVAADGSGRRRITTFQPHIKDSFGAYSPDGQQVVWSTARFVTGDAGMQRIPVAGGQISTLPGGINADWQPATTTVALTPRLGHFAPVNNDSAFRADEASAAMVVYLGDPAPAGGTTVTLSSSDPTLADPPPTFTVPAGKASATVKVPLGDAPGPSSSEVTLTATLGARSVSSTLTLFPVAQLSFFTLGNVRAEGNPSIIQLTMPAPAGGAQVHLSSSDPILKVPATLTVPVDKTQAGFKLFVKEVKAPKTVTVTATYAGTTLTQTVDLQPDPKVVGVTLSPTSVTGGGSTGNFDVTVTLDRPVPTGAQGATLLVTTTSDSDSTLQHDVRIFPGDTTATATEGTKAVPATVIANISARTGGQTRSAPLTIRPGNPVPPDQPDVASYTVSPSTFPNGTSATGTVTLTAPAPAGGTEVSFTEHTAIAVVNDQVVPAGQTSITFPVRSDYPLAYPKPISGTLIARTRKPYSLGKDVRTTVTLTPAPDPPPGPFPG